MAWQGHKLVEAAREASRYGIDKIMADCVIAAKSSHPGWHNITGTAEGSIRIVDFARDADVGAVGLWGSVDVDYMIWLELNHGSALRNAADVNYPRLRQVIAERLHAAG